MFWDVIQEEFAWRALLASAIVGVTCGFLGCFVVLRKMALIGDALSHAILPGVVLGFVFFGHHPVALFGGAVLAGLFTSVLITWIQRNSITKDDASIGIVFTGMFAAGVIGISWLTKQEGVHLDLKDFLFGNVLGVSNADLWLTGLVGIYVLCSMTLFFKYFFISTFDPLIAMTMGISVGILHYFFMFLLSLTIVASLQSVGVILVVAMLIVPASTAYLLTKSLKKMLLLSSLTGLISACLGLYLSILWELTPGPVMTLVSVLIFGIVLMLSPDRGMLVLAFRNLRKNYIYDQQDLLKLISKKTKEGSLTYFQIYQYWPYGAWLLKLHLRHLKYHKHIQWKKQHIYITASGQHEADLLVRAHRLWESFMSKEMNLPADIVHDTAERYEHMLPKEFIDKLDKHLDYPQKDPHGAPIPQLLQKKTLLSELFLGQKGIIDEQQEGMVRILWSKGIMPLAEFEIIDLKENTLTLNVQNHLLELPISDAQNIFVKI